MNTETINGLIPFELKGDLQKFEEAYILYLDYMGISKENAINLLSSIWLFANKCWSEGSESNKMPNKEQDVQVSDTTEA